MSERFAPKVPVQLEDPKDDPITVEELSKCDGTFSLPVEAEYANVYLHSRRDTKLTEDNLTTRYGSQPSDLGSHQGYRFRRIQKPSLWPEWFVSW
ncbi:unnamed protein product [Aspergillus oryzae]|uniref:Unnamed protein product n=2 Tax=Aspergillus oryzae TaxID=5062 RepID=A0AAN4YWD5_ASPOZ|nr:unnamed protein product [Aspergillus oryzae]GMF84192.1 unnamed protein product [Aspergillus oryzae]GMG36247.1 unnamed protein product [Aspergillus oryzae]GMG54769.1 unnamed protein product [Aspergillus oryzae var. brunneus]